MDKIYVTSPSLPPFDEYVAEIGSLWTSGVLTHQGPKYKELEDKVCGYLGVDYAALFANGHLALEGALWATCGDEGGEIITTPYTFASTTQAIVHMGFTPVFCDIDKRTMTIDVNKITDLISPKTKGILGVHVYGLPCDVDGIARIAEEHGLAVVYDAAHAFGERLRGKGVGRFGDVSMFSFHATKVFNTVEGGGLTFADDTLYRKLCAWRQFGSYESEAVDCVGTNAKMTEMHACMGLCNLRHMSEFIAARKQAFERYQEALRGLYGVTTISYPADLEPNYAYYPVLFNPEECGCTRDEVADALEAEGIFGRKYFYPLTSSFGCYRNKFAIQETPVAERISNEILCLPLYSGLSLEDVDRVTDVLLRRLGRK